MTTDNLNDIGPGQPRADSKFMLLVGLMFLVIMGLLAGLWLKMRSRAMAAEATAVKLTRERQGLQLFVEQMTKQGKIQISVDRRALSRRAVMQDGKPVQALLLPAGLGELFGFEPGDVVIVERTPATASAPATGPATAPE